MRTPAFVYGGAGLLTGLVLSYVYAGTFDLTDLLIGSLIGVFLGFFLALSKQHIWDRR